MKTFTCSLLFAILYYAAGAQCAPPVVTASGSTTLCPGGSVTLSAPAGNVWMQKADFGGTARSNATGFSIGSKGYIGTGSIGGTYYKDFWEYNPATDVWTQKADFGGTARGSATGFAIGSKGYIGLGYYNGTSYKDFWEYDPSGNIWTRKANFEGIEREGATGFSIGSKGYIGTGYSTSLPDATKDFWEYNPATDVWTQKADFGGVAKSGAVGFSIGGKGYIGTGYTSSGRNTKDFWQYDPSADVWIRKADFGGTARGSATGFAIGSKGYIGLGYDGADTKDFWQYDLSADVWIRKADFGGDVRRNATGFNIGSKGYIGTGHISYFTENSFYNKDYKDFWEYDPGYTYAWSPGGQTTPSISASASGNYTVTTTNATDCSATSAATLVTISTPVTPVITAPGGTAICPGGGSVTLSTPASNVWTQKANVGIGTRGMASGFAIGNKGYVGMGQLYGTLYKDFWEYDPVTNVWTQKADFGGAARQYATGFSVGSKGYIGTGYGIGIGNYYKDFWEYDPSTNAWTQKADFGGTPKAVATGFSIGSKGYIGTGENSSGVTNDFWEYDPSTDKWTRKADFGGTARSFAVGFSIGTKGYIGTGDNGSSSSIHYKDFWEYDPATDKWTRKADFDGTERSFAAGFSIGSKGYIGTGGNPGIYYNDFWEYDPGYIYSWSPGGQTTSSVTVSSPGNYTVTTTNAFGCSATSAVKKVTAYSSNILYVDSSKATSGDGSSWANAFKELREALYAASQCSSITTINIAKGTYKPTDDTNRDSAFAILRGGLKIYGGYPGGGGTRNPAVNPTVLSGDIGTAGNASDNSYHVVVIAGLTSSADSLVLDGFTVTGGDANGSNGKVYNGAAISQNEGAGIYLHSNNGAGRKIAVRSCTVTGNTSATYGGGFYNQLSSPAIFNCRFTGNTAADGGGMFNYNASSPSVSNSMFTGNIASNLGAGMHNLSNSSPSVINCTFAANTGRCVYNAFSSPSFTNCLFVSNNALGNGSAMYNANSSSVVTNCTFTLNTSSGNGTIFNENPSSPQFTNCIIWGNAAIANGGILNTISTPTVTYSDAQGGYSGTGNISSDPLFINKNDADGADNIFGTADDGLKLQSGSSAGNAGNNAGVPAGVATDITGAARIQSGTVDMGAYESLICSSFATIYVDSSKTTSGDGSSWAEAFKELRDALYYANQCSSIAAIHVAKGTYKPTNDAGRDSTFAIYRGGLKIDGGYPTGGGTKNTAANQTVLSGDIGAISDSTDNSYHILVIVELGSNADSVVIDGFTITKAHAFGTGRNSLHGISVSRQDGGGIYAGGQVSSKTAIRNCIITANSAYEGGGIMNELGSSPTLMNCVFAKNSAVIDGGGIYNSNCLSVIKGCSFTGNRAGLSGAGMQNGNSSVVVDSCIFSNNLSGDGGGGVQNENSSPYFSNCTFINNFSENNRGGGMANIGGSPVVTNCTFIRNYSYNDATAVSNEVSRALFKNCTFSANYGDAGSVISTSGTTPVVVTNSIIWGNNKVSIGNTTVSNPAIYNTNGGNTTVTYSDIQGGYSGTGNISSDPLFIDSADADGADNIFGTADDGLHLQAGSPAINTGSNAAVPAGVTTDIAGAARIQDGIVDIGAYEGSSCPSFTTLFVDSSITAPGNGGSWATAFKTVQQALNASNSCSSVKQVWIKKGTYYPAAYPVSCTDCATSNSARDYTFALRDGLALYGGFAGAETDTAQRVSGNTTVLSGDIGVPNDNSDNCYHVLFAINGTNRLSGLTVTGGNANDNGLITVAGQTIYHSNGGGLYQNSASATLYNCTFTGNAAKSEGGGVFHIYGSALRITASRFLNNQSGAGGAIRLLYGNAGFVSLNSVYSGNTASFNDAGALSLVMGSGTDTLINNLFVQNKAFGSTADNGAGALVQENGTSSYIVNNTFYADSAVSNGGAIRFKSGGSNRYLYNNIFYKSYNGTDNTDVSVESGTTITAQSNNLYSTTDPLFANPADADGADNIFGTSDDGVHLQTGSPAQNTGSNAAIPSGITTDVTGAARIFNCTADMGAYEVIDNVNTYWTGLVSNDWNNSGNWCSGIPASGAGVLIPVSAPYSPKLSSSVALGNLIIANSIGLSLNGNTLTLAGTVSGTGVITGSSASSLIINGSGDAGMLYFDPSGDGTTNALRDITINRASSGSVTLGNKLNLTGIYTPSAGVLNTGGYLTLKSDTNGTASVASNTSGTPYIIGNVTVERYTPLSNVSSTRTGRAWRLLSSPVINGQTIRQAWQENGNNAAGYGTLITGENMPDAATAARQGYDFTGAGFHASIKHYVASSNSWLPLNSDGSTTGTNIAVRTEQAYMLFVRGDRTVGTSGASVATLRAAGTLVQGTQPAIPLSGGKFTLMGNPYASSIDFGSVYGHNSPVIKNQFYLWNSKLGVYGAYTLIDKSGSGTYQATPSPLAGSGTAGNDSYRYIPSGAGFFVMPETGVSTGNIIVQESDKAPGQAPPVNPFRVVSTPTNVKELVVNLNLRDSDTSVTLADGFRAKFSPDYEGNEEDNSSTKVYNFNENLNLVYGGKAHIIEARGEVKKTDTLFMKMWYVTKRSYQLQVKGDNFTSAPGIQAWLEDGYLGTKQPLSLSGSVTTVNFEVNNDSLSSKSDRFRIVFQNTASIALPVTLTSVSATPANGGVSVSWTVNNEVNVKSYTVQRSTDGGSTYTDIAMQPAKNGTAVTTYSSWDAQPVTGDNLYLVRIEAKDAGVSYSQVVKVTIGNGSGIRVRVYPNPATTKATVHIDNLTDEISITLTDSKGDIVWKKEKVTASDTVIPVAHLANGAYLVVIKNKDGVIKTMKLVKAD